MIHFILLSLAASQYTINDHSVGVQLFQWPFADIGKECVNFLGPNGYGWVQTSPVSPHARDAFDGTRYPWYLAYQPLGYTIGNRLGSEQDFKDMVSACRSVGVDVVVDVVLNHNANAEGSDSSGFGISQSWSTQTFAESLKDAGLSSQDYHDSICAKSTDQMPYTDFNQHNCRAGNLVDLKTESDYVRTLIAGFLNKILSFGAIGFRTDLSTFVPVADWKMTPNYKGVPAFFGQEAYPMPGDNTYQDYPSLGRIFSESSNGYTTTVGQAFRNLNGRKVDQLMSILSSQPLSAGQTIGFIENWDQERNSDGNNNLPLSRLNNGWYYRQAIAFNILYPFGLAQVHSGYAFTFIGGNTRESPVSAPFDDSGYILPVPISNGQCDSRWVCQHRMVDVYPLVRVRQFMGNTAVPISTLGAGSNQIFWSAPGKGFVAINSAQNSQPSMSMQVTVKTGLKPGNYCNMVYARAVQGSCKLWDTVVLGNSEQVVYTVDGNGQTRVNLKDADRSRVLALYGGSDGYYN